jgi:hypothetical protein
MLIKYASSSSGSVDTFGGVRDLPRIFCVMSADIDADAGYNVLSMSKNTTYFELLSVDVAIIPGDLVYGSCWVSSDTRYGLEVCPLLDTRKTKRGGSELGDAFFVFLIWASFRPYLFLFGIILHETSFQKVFPSSASLRFPIFPINWCHYD